MIKVKLYCAHEYLNKSNQNLVHYIFCQAVRPTAYLNFCGSLMLKGLGLGTMALALASIEGPGLEILALTTLLQVTTNYSYFCSKIK